MTTPPNSPPVHVHIDKATPVHVHVKSFKRSNPIKTPQAKPANTRPTAEVKTRFHWKPPGRDSTQDAPFKWEGPSHCLEIVPPRVESEFSQPLRLPDFRSVKENKDEGTHDQVSEYQRKIDILLTEVSSLKDKHALALQEEQLAKMSRELEETEMENIRLRQSMDKMLEESECTRHQGKDCLLRKLKEAERDGAAVRKQVSSLRAHMSKTHTSDNRLCGTESSVLARQEELLRQKLKASEDTNQALRRLIREEHDYQVEMIQLSEEKAFLLNKLTDMEAENAHIVMKLKEKEREVKHLCELLDAQKNTSMSSTSVSRSLESAKAHLQGQLRSKEAENNRLSVQIKNLKQAAHYQRLEMDRLRDQVIREKQQASAERESLKKATEAQRRRSENGKDAVGQLRAQLLEVEKQLSEALSAAETWQSHFTQEMKDKRKLEAELTLVNSQMSKLAEQLKCTENKNREERESFLDHLHGLTTENTAAKLENQKLKAASSAVEEKVAMSQSEVEQVKASIKQYESLLESYKMQIQKTRDEADEYCVQLAKAEQQALVTRGEFLGRLAELEPLSEELQRSQQQLQEAQDRERRQEKDSIELGEAISNLKMKVESQGSQMEFVSQENKVLLEENQLLQERVEGLERKLNETSCQNTELIGAITKKEEMIHSNQLQLDEKARESSLLNRKLEEALNDARQQMLDSRERAATKERSTQAKILELETQLSRTTSEVNQLRRSKEEVTQRYQSRLQDVKDRLEQTDNTNRSLQNYVQFLKNSYATVFADVSLGSALLGPPTM